ncbi:Na+/H+ antiporter subunit E [Enhydrobacter sp.]|jgi:multicomponent K+:H+ antiporter subunit E|uniref:Na+/H+ antiporter subunit E n=1 Tax=Enhydrobacter sp. TaxID=1894999 RepID=UPI00261F7A9E|nr:Na+/H+ antiporter subunit E [Enhydrobacter sp.]WIM09154.1 MAG: Na(+) H(+) antiporter subunit E [Enhydrobacter sp.]
MMRLLRFPLATVGLLLLWLVLNQSLSPGHVLLGIVVAAVGAWTLGTLRVPQGRVRRPVAILRLVALVLVDIVRSNLAVARIILGGRRGMTSGFVRIPLELRHPYGLATLACIITATPGTLWVALDEAEGILTIHVLDLIDHDAWIRTIKGRYERSLLEIFP